MHGRCTWLLIIRFTEHKAALIGFKFLLIGIYGELLSGKEGWRGEAGLPVSGPGGVPTPVEAVCQLGDSHTLTPFVAK